MKSVFINLSKICIQVLFMWGYYLSSEVVNKKVKKALLSIYDNFYIRSNEACLDVFLCGKGNKRGETSLRDSLRVKFKDEKNIRIIYPEDLFMDIFNKKKNYDMLSLEKFLADNCDVICIICEDNSPGAFVELGAFTNNSDTYEKVLVMVQSKYKNNKSFIMLGPIKYLEQRNKDNVLYYSTDIEGMYRKLYRRLRSKLRYKNLSRDRGMDSIIGQYYFILMLIYFFSTITVKDLLKYVKFVIEKRNVEVNDFDLLYSASLKQLYKDKMIEKSNDNYLLTEKGKLKFYNTFRSIRLPQKTKKGDSIRLSVLSQQYY